MKLTPLLTACSLSVVMLLPLRSNAQNLYLGARVGANIASEFITPGILDEGESYSNLTGFLGGLQADWRFGKTWGITASVLYDQKGTRVSYNESGQIYEFDSANRPHLIGPYSMTGTSDLTLNYLECTVLLKARFLSGDFRPYVVIGPSVGWLLSGKLRNSYSGVSGQDHYRVDTTLSTPVGDYYTPTIPASTPKSLDASLVLGGGAEFQLESGQVLFLDASYAYGFKDIGRYPDDFPLVKSRDIRLAAGVLFPLN